MSYYVSSLELRQARAHRRNQNSVRFDKSVKSLGPISNTLILAVILATLGLLYLTQITKTNSFGYQVNDLSTKKEALIEERQELLVESARLQALERIENSEVAKNLTTATSQEFVAQ